MTVPAVTNEQRLSLGLEGLGIVGVSGSLKVVTEDSPSFLDITDRVAEFVREAGVVLGLVVVFSRHTTAAVVLNENEPLLMQDVAAFLEKLAPRNGHYLHNDFTIRTVNMNEDECANGHAHCQHLFLSASETIPVIEGRMSLGTWQRIFLIELDHPRLRRVLVNCVGAG